MTAGGKWSRPILLVGGSGQVGFELRRTLSEVALVVSPPSAELDLLKPQIVRSYVDSLKPGLIVNAAAHTAVDLCETEEGKAKALNEDAPTLLAECARKQQIGLIHYSTDYVFDGKKPTAYLESDPPNPLSVYGRTKLGGEQGILASGAAALIFRCEWVYSRRGKNFLLTMLRLGSERDSLSVVADQHGVPTWAAEIATATSAVISRSYGAAGGPTAFFNDHAGVYHMAGMGSTTWFGFAEAIFERGTGRRPMLTPITTDQYPTPARRPANSVFDTAKLANTFGVSLRDWRLQLDQAMSTT